MQTPPKLASFVHHVRIVHFAGVIVSLWYLYLQLDDLQFGVEKGLKTHGYHFSHRGECLRDDIVHDVMENVNTSMRTTISHCSLTIFMGIKHAGGGRSSLLTISVWTMEDDTRKCCGLCWNNCINPTS